MLWRGRSKSLTRTVDAHVSRIRKRLMINSENGHRLVAAYGNGYRLEKTHDTWVSPLLTVDLHVGGERLG
jgi:DNA-binding response OmpR family regulator